MALSVLKNLLVRLYTEPVFETFCLESLTPANKARIMTELGHVVTETPWKRSTAHKIMCLLRKILVVLKLPEQLLRLFKLPPKKRDWNNLLGKKYGRLPPTNASRRLLESWVQILRETTSMKSEQTLKNPMSFYINTVLPTLGLSIDTWSEKNNARMLTPAEILTICGKGLSTKKKIHWLQIFVGEILQSKAVIDEDVFKQIRRNARCLAPPSDVEGDKFRISTEDLEVIYKQAIKDPFDQLFFLTMLTTGIRIGGFVRIKCEAVATFTDNAWVSRKQGWTTEKGSKKCSFVLQKTVRECITDWLNKHRPASSSEYICPGVLGGHICTETVRSHFGKLCSNAGLLGERYRPHSLRHSFAHILLESGNSVEIVSKLINHSSVRTTEKHYLKESALEVTQRANLPWLSAQDKGCAPNPVPLFLRPEEPPAKKARGKLETLRLFNQA
jgi:site-specific recombinase XerD